MLLDLGETGKLALYTSDAILEELEGVLSRKKFAERVAAAVPPVTAASLLQHYAALATSVSLGTIERTGVETTARNRDVEPWVETGATHAPDAGPGPHAGLAVGVSVCPKSVTGVAPRAVASGRLRARHGYRRSRPSRLPLSGRPSCGRAPPPLDDKTRAGRPGLPPAEQPSYHEGPDEHPVLFRT